jgi:transcriptional regulator with XRE-family HTH domain
MNVTANNIKTLREKNVWSQRLIAKKLGISVPDFSKIETGMTDINITRLSEIAGLLGVSVMDLISKKDTPPVNDIIEIDRLKAKIKEREEEITVLQTKIINLYEELRENK